MKKWKLYPWMAALAALPATDLMAQTEVVKGVMHGKEYGVTYTLPKTELSIAVKVKKTVYKPGRLNAYAERYLRTKTLGDKPFTKWEMQEIDVRGVGVPDKDGVYFVRLKDKSTAPLMELTSDGVVKSINVPIEQIEKDATRPAPAKEKEQLPRPEAFLTQEILMTSSNAKMAELVAKEIYDIRESKNNLLRGQADQMPTDGAQLKIMLDNLTKQEKALMAMFIGTSETDVQTVDMRFVPEKEVQETVACRFSEIFGLLPPDDLAGEPIYISVKDMHSLPQEELENKKSKTEGVAYNQPGMADVTVSYGQKKLVHKRIPNTYFGTREYLAPVLFKRGTKTQVIFDVNTGALKKVHRTE